MKEKLGNYLDVIFSPYKDVHSVKELKEELLNDLQEKLTDLRNKGYDDEAAFRLTIDSIGDVSEIMDSLTVRTTELQQQAGMDFSKSNLEKSDFSGASILGKFDYSNLKGSDFSGSDLTSSTFKCSNLNHVKFDGANLARVKIVRSSLSGASFHNCVFDNTDFSSSELSGASLDNETFNGTIFNAAGLAGVSFKNAVFRNVSFKNAYVKRANFDGATMDKLTYAFLKSNKNANLTNVTVI